jgi:amino acid transporter
MVVVVASYRQNVHAYPSGGGDYEVATVNLGPKAGLTVASALLVDYVLTVAVSISSGVRTPRLPFRRCGAMRSSSRWPWSCSCWPR